MANWSLVMGLRLRVCEDARPGRGDVRIDFLWGLRLRRVRARRLERGEGGGGC